MKFTGISGFDVFSSLPLPFLMGEAWFVGADCPVDDGSNFTSLAGFSNGDAWRFKPSDEVLVASARSGRCPSLVAEQIVACELDA